MVTDAIFNSQIKVNTTRFVLRGLLFYFLRHVTDWSFHSFLFDSFFFGGIKTGKTTSSKQRGHDQTAGHRYFLKSWPQPECRGEVLSGKKMELPM